MSFAADLRTRLLAVSGVTDLVGTRVYRGFRNQGSGLPAVTIEVLDDPKDYAHDGDLSARDALVQVDCFDDDWAGVDALADAVEAAMPVAGGTWGSSTVQACRQTGRRDIHDEPKFGDQRNVARITMDFSITH